MTQDALANIDRTSWAYQNMVGQDRDWSPSVLARNVTSSTNVNPLDAYIRADATAGAITLTLETAVAADGRIHYIKKIDASANAVTIAGFGSQTIDGAATLVLADRWDTALLVCNGTNWELIGATGGVGGGTGGPWARIGADGTKLAGQFISGNASIFSEGKFDVTLTKTASVVAGEWQINAVATPTTSAAGATSGGASVFKAFSDATYSPTDPGASTEPTQAFYSSSQDKIFVLGHQADLIYVHRIDGFFPVDPPTINAGTIRIPSQSSGCMKREGDYIWLSGDSVGPLAVRAVLTASPNTVTNFGTTTDIKCLAAATIGGVHYLFVAEGSSVNMYAPNLGTGALGAIVKTWSITGFSADSPFGVWDNNGMLWLFPVASVAMLNPVTGLHYTHAYPSGLSAKCPPAYDSARNRFYVRMGAGASANLYVFSGWNENAHNTGVFTVLASLIESSALWFDKATDILFSLSDAQEKAVRLNAGTGVVLDAVSVDDLAPNLNVDFELLLYPNVFYKDDCAYFLGQRAAGGNMLVRARYRGVAVDYPTHASIGSTGSTANAEVAYLSGAAAIWLIDADNAPNGLGGNSSRLFTFAPATSTWTDHAFDATYYRLHGVGRYMVPLESWDQMIIQSRGASVPSVPVVWRISTKSVIDNYWAYLTGFSFSADVWAVDQPNNRVLLKDGVDPYTMKLWALHATTHMPTTQIDSAVMATAVSDGGAIVDSSGNFWFRTTAAWVKWAGGPVVTFAYDADGVGSTTRSTFAYDPARNCIYYWSALSGAPATGKLKKIDCSTGTISTIATYSASVVPFLPDRPMLFDAGRDRIFVVHGGTASSRDWALFKVDPTTGNFEQYTMYDTGNSHFISPSVAIDTTNGAAYSFSVPGHLAPKKGLGRVNFTTLESAAGDADGSASAGFFCTTRTLAANKVRVEVWRLAIPPVPANRQFSLKVDMIEA